MEDKIEEIKKVFSQERMVAANDFNESLVILIKEAYKNQVPFVIIEGILFKETINVYRTAETRPEMRY